MFHGFCIRGTSERQIIIQSIMGSIFHLNRFFSSKLRNIISSIPSLFSLYRPYRLAKEIFGFAVQGLLVRTLGKVKLISDIEYNGHLSLTVDSGLIWD